MQFVQNLFLQLNHPLLVRRRTLMIVVKQVQQAMNGQPGQFLVGWNIQLGGLTLGNFETDEDIS